jgi:hypothetical protein
MEYYFGATGGGLWKTTDGGQNWAPVTDGQINSASVGAVGVCEADPDIVYIGTGETEMRGNIQQGDGLYKSTDAGETWTHIGLTETQNVSRVRIHPTDCNTVFVAAMGKHSIQNPERGVYRTTDGGDTWDLVLNREGNEWTGAVDISFDPNNTDLIYASLWEAWRKSWGLSSGGEGSGLFRSTDGGDNWEELTGNKPGLHSGIIGTPKAGSSAPTTGGRPGNGSTRIAISVSAPSTTHGSMPTRSTKMWSTRSIPECTRARTGARPSRVVTRSLTAITMTCGSRRTITRA